MSNNGTTEFKIQLRQRERGITEETRTVRRWDAWENQPDLREEMADGQMKSQFDLTRS